MGEQKGISDLELIVAAIEEFQSTLAKHESTKPAADRLGELKALIVKRVERVGGPHLNAWDPEDVARAAFIAGQRAEWDARDTREKMRELQAEATRVQIERDTWKAAFDGLAAAIGKAVAA